jgi:hypothetical protein
VAELFPGRGRQCFHHSEISREVGRRSGLSVISSERSGKVLSGARAKNVCDAATSIRGALHRPRTNTHKARVKTSTHATSVLAPAAAVTAGVCAWRNGVSTQLRRTNSQALMSAVCHLRRVSGTASMSARPQKAAILLAVSHTGASGENRTCASVTAGSRQQRSLPRFSTNLRGILGVAFGRVIFASNVRDIDTCRW